MEEKLEQQSADCLRVVLYGPESTGKTTLARQLAERFDTVWVPEFMRDYSQEKWDREGRAVEQSDMLPMATGQMQLENQLAPEANKVLICDTNLMELVVYSKAYYQGWVDPLLLKPALKAQYDLYILTYIDVPWVKDDLRDRPNQRDWMFSMFKETLDAYNLPYQTLKGNYIQRLDRAEEMIVQLINDKKIGLK